MTQFERMLTYIWPRKLHNLRFLSTPGPAAVGYKDIDWARCNTELKTIQSEIVTAYRSRKFKHTKLLQKKLVRSFAARALAIKRVSSNKGSSTAGVDNILWTTDQLKINAVKSLKNLKNYRAQPVRRVYISKSDGSLRPLGIPTLFDRAVQALWYSALIPIAEEVSDDRSYGFKPFRSTRDCVQYLKLVVGSYTNTRRFVLDADIKSFFDTVSHEWLLQNIPMDPKILSEFIKAGYLDDSHFKETSEGFPQGGIISPVIANLTLDGLQKELNPEFLMTRYVDDFVVLGKSHQALEKEAIPIVESFLKIRGLKLNMRKTHITDIVKGFDFLGFNFREFPDKNRIKGSKKGIFLAQPSKIRILQFKRKLSTIIRNHKNIEPYVLILKLNPIIRGWSEYYRIATATRAFNLIGHHLFRTIWAMLTKKYRGLGRRVIRKRHFITRGNYRWVFTDRIKPEDSRVDLFQIQYVKMKRHMICRALNHLDPDNYSYFEKRRKNFATAEAYPRKIHQQLIQRQKGMCPVCLNSIRPTDDKEIHHILSRKHGGTDKKSNLVLLHKQCHHQVTHTKNQKLLASFIDRGVLRMPQNDK